MAKQSNEEYLENLLGQVSKYTSDEDFLNELDGDFPELNDEKFMEQYAEDIDNVFEEGYVDKTLGMGKHKPTVSGQAPAGSTDLFGVDKLIDEAVAESTADSDIPDLPDIPELSEIPDLPDVPDISEIPDLPEVPDISENPDLPEVPDISTDTAGDLDLGGLGDVGDMGDLGDLSALGDLDGGGDLGGAGDLGDLGDLSDLGDLGDLGDLSGAVDLDGAGDLGDLSDLGDLGDLSDLGDVADLDNLGGGDAAPAGDAGVSDELASLFDETEDFSATDLTDEGAVSDLVSSDSDLSDLADMLSSEGGDESLDIFDGLEGLDDSFNNGEEMSMDDLLGELGGEAGAAPVAAGGEEEKPAKKKKGFFGFIAAIFDSANAQDDEPELTKEEKEALKEEKKKAKEEKKALKAEKKKAKEEKKKAKEAAKPKKEKKPKEEGPKEKSKPLPKLKTILIFLLAASIVVLFKFGMDFLSYNMMVDKAKSAFTNSNFTEAYNTISGYKVKPTEQKLQKQIVLVNKLYKHLNSYENLVQIKIYTQALNQLLNGVKQYDEAIKEAEELGVKEQYDTILDKLSSRLISGFGIGLSRAREIIAYNDEILYSNAIYEIISEKYGADAK